MRRTHRMIAALAAVLGAAVLGGPASADSTHRTMTASSAARAPAKSAASVFPTAVKFRNRYDTTVWVAYMRYDPDDCGEDGNWATRGWVRLNPGEVKQAFSTSNRYAYFYAKATDGAEWNGDNQPNRSKPVNVYHASFDSCIGIGSSDAYDSVSMRRIDVRGSVGLLRRSHTVGLS